MIASCSDDWTICLWDAERGAQVGSPLQGHTGSVCIWDVQMGMQLGNPFLGHSGPVKSLSFSPDGRRILSSSYLTICLCAQGRRTTIVRLQTDGWIVGPNGQVLLWIPIRHYPFLYYPQSSVLVIHGNAVELDLSRMAHGSNWQQCFLIGHL
ncbi:hypothetical protein ID866_11301 [Astraeus odoratus]|nr:hypothetical protein ID866_11301 [Astraeus odoratus]